MEEEETGEDKAGVTETTEEDESAKEITEELRKFTFDLKDRTVDLPMGEREEVVKAFGPILEKYCRIVPKVAEMVQGYFSKEQVPVELIKAMDIYYFELKRALRKYPEVEEDQNLKNAIDAVVKPYEKAIRTMVDIARNYATQRGHNYDTDY